MARRSLCLLIPALFVALAAQTTPAAQSPTADEVIARNLAAKGGLDRIRQVTSLRQTSEFTIQGLSGTMTTYYMRPNLMRQEMNFGGPTTVNGFDGETPWMVNPASGSSQAIVMQGPQAELARRQASFDGPLVDYKERGITAELLAPETVDGSATHHLRLTLADGHVQHLYIDQQSMLEVRSVMEAPGGTVEQRYSDFRQVDGLTIPFAIEIRMAGQPAGSVKVTKVEINPSLEVSIFRIPR